jgi:dihydropteroate synthase
MAASKTDAVTKKSTSSPSSKRGRPEASERQADKQMALLARWTRAKEAGVTRKRFCADEGIEVKELERIQDWARQRRKRGKA